MAKRGRKPGGRNPVTHPAPGKKRCSTCKAVKSLAAFREQGRSEISGIIYYTAPCKDCLTHLTFRSKWKTRVKREGTDCLVERISELVFLTKELRSVLRECEREGR